MMNKNQVLIKAKEIFRQCRQNKTGGSSAPGGFALSEYPQILRELSEDISTVIVCGTNGKTTTTRMTAAMLEASGVPCFSNSTGANVDSGTCTAFILNTDENGIGIKKTAVIECDEKFTDMLCRETNPQVIIITNITDGQIDRLGTAEDVMQRFCDCFKKTDATICINENCPLSMELKKKLKGKKTVLYSGQPGKIIYDGTQYPAELNIPGRYNFSNAAAAFAGAVSWLNMNNKTADSTVMEKMLSALDDFALPFGRMETFSAGKTNITINLVKNKAGADETLFYINSLKKDFKIVLGFNRNSPDGRDTTWIESIDFQTYRSLFTDTVIFGGASEKLAETLEREKIAFSPCGSFENLFERITAEEKPVFMLLNYTCMMDIRRHLADMGYIKNFWEM